MAEIDNEHLNTIAVHLANIDNSLSGINNTLSKIENAIGQRTTLSGKTMVAAVGIIAMTSGMGLLLVAPSLKVIAGIAFVIGLILLVVSFPTRR